MVSWDAAVLEVMRKGELLSERTIRERVAQNLGVEGLRQVSPGVGHAIKRLYAALEIDFDFTSGCYRRLFDSLESDKLAEDG